VITFLIIGITVIWCHSFTKLADVGGKSTTVSLLNFLLCFISFYLLFYLSYILRRWLLLTQQMTSSTTSSIALEEARTAAILGSKRWCENVFNLNLYGYIWCDVANRCDVANGCDIMNILILYGFACLNECFGFRCVYGCIVYYVNLLCRFFNSSCVGYTIFCKTKFNPG
jgi:hypothetical protein